jgi:acetyl-CoA carboxylase biotin carboxyl carrier protein
MTRRHDVAALIATIDGLEALLERADLTELEVEAGGTTIVLRTPSAIAPAGLTVEASRSAPASGAAAPVRAMADADDRDAPTPPGEAGLAAHLVVAPLTGIFYRSPSPGAVPYLREGGPVNAGQVIGLIEAMKLYNEIKSDVTGIVRRLVAGDGALVKARDPLIEVEPA